MASILKWPGVWFRMVLKPEETAAKLKAEKPTLVDGIISFGLCNFLIGLAVFLIFAIISLIGFAVAGDIIASLISLAISFAIFAIVFPIMMLISLLILSVILKISSSILKGKGSLGEECGFLGVIGSPYTILMVLMYLCMLVPVMLLSGFAVFFGLGSLALIYITIGIISVIFSPMVYILMAFAFDLLAEIEKVSIYRSGAIIGLMIGIATFLLMLIIAAFLFIVGGAMYGLTRGMYY
jgi:hypothetical protein